MNHHDHGHGGHVNGKQVNGNATTEEELDAYEENLTTEAVLDQIKTFFTAQELRVSLYHEFETAFRDHVAGEKSDSEFVGIITSTTSSFNEISRRIIRCEEVLKDDLDRADLSGMIRRIQQSEKEKFEATVKAQMWERQDGERDFSNDIREARKTRQDAIESINEVMEELRAEIY